MEGQLKNGTILTSESGNKYEVVSLLGAGGQGEVYDVKLGSNHYALKWYFKGSATERQKMLMYGKEASNRKQEIDRQHYTIPNQRPKDKHCGKI